MNNKFQTVTIISKSPKNPKFITFKEKIIISKLVIIIKNKIHNTINNNIEVSKEIAEYLYKKNSLFILGKGIMESAALEGVRLPGKQSVMEF